MSKVSIAGNASGSATFTIAAPATNTDRTLTLPDNSGTVLTSASNLAGVTGVGKVLQVVSATSSTQVTVATSTFTDTTLSATITPTSSSSKILIVFSQNFFNISAGNAPMALLLRNGTGIVTYGFPAYAGTSTLMHYFSSNYLDSPATGSAVTYKLQVKLQTGSGTVIANYTDVNGTPVSVMTLMEIAA